MFKLLGAIGRFFRAMFYTLAGDVSKWSTVWESSTGYINSEYDSMEKEQQTDIEELTEAVAALMDIVRQKETRFEDLNLRIEDKKRKMAGAKAKAERKKNELVEAGKTDIEIKSDPIIQKCLSYYNGFKSELALAEEESSLLDAELVKHDADINKYKTRLQKAHKELEKIRIERHETIADLKLAQQEQKVSATLLGLSESRVADRRNRIQEMRRKNRLKADIQSEMAGVVAEDAEQEFLDFAQENESSTEFFEMIGLDNQKLDVFEEKPKNFEEKPKNIDHIPE